MYCIVNSPRKIRFYPKLNTTKVVLSDSNPNDVLNFAFTEFFEAKHVTSNHKIRNLPQSEQTLSTDMILADILFM